MLINVLTILSFKTIIKRRIYKIKIKINKKHFLIINYCIIGRKSERKIKTRNFRKSKGIL